MEKTSVEMVRPGFAMPRFCAEEIGNGNARMRDAMLWSGLEKRRFGMEWRSYELETKIREPKGDNA